MDATKQSADREARPVTYWITLAILAAGVLVYIVLVTRPGPPRPGDEGPAIGHKLSYLQLQGLTGGAGDVTLEDLPGRVTLINYWGTWCPPCIQEFPHIVRLADKYGDRDDFNLLAVSCGTATDPSLDELRPETEAFLEQRHVDLPTYADENAATRKAMIAQFHIAMGYPTTLVLDREGIVRGFWQGFDPRTPESIEAMVEKVLAEPPPAADKQAAASHAVGRAVAARSGPDRPAR